ncbi:MAG TPA: hypothetical protein VNN80_21865 [Polyangiaceae bacterium]|nr:hypothetical protein [Polyangiaceae bacterium]
MRRLSLLRGLLFALVAGLGVLLWLSVAGPLIGSARAASLYGLALLPGYALAVAPDVRRAAGAFLLAAALALPVSFFATGPRFVFVLTPFVLGIVRSAILFPRPFARALFLEACCSLLAVGVAVFFHDASAVGMTFAVWGFWLVQAGFALAPGEPAAAPLAPAGDPFEAARDRALAILERRA